MSSRRDFLKGAGVLGVGACVPRIGDAQGGSENRTLADDAKAPGQPALAESGDITIENAEMRLVIAPDGSAKSLFHKRSGQECLLAPAGEPMFTLTQYRPYDNELQLAYPARTTRFPARTIRLESSRLVVGFTEVGYTASVIVTITDAYIAFRLDTLSYHGYTSMRPKEKTPIDETVFVQLPVRDRTNFGDWLNVMWDDTAAIALIATDVHTQIEAEPRRDHHLFQAGTVRDVKLENAGAALIVTTPDRLLDCIARVEEDFGLPRGVEGRRRPQARYSYYQPLAITPKNAAGHLHFAQMAGFRAINVYCLAFARSVGHFPYRPEYPRGIADLQDIVMKARKAGMTPGLHILYTMADEEDDYVRQRADPRLNLFRSFTLASNISESDTVIPVEENPWLCPVEDGRRAIKIQNELIVYKTFTTSEPYRFEDCERGFLGSQAATHESSSRVGLLDIYGGGPPSDTFVRFNQSTNIQAEVAKRIKEFYERAGFEFLYFDGAEQVSAPFWYTIPKAQQVIYDSLKTKPLYAEGSCKAHFSWHFLTRGNAFDTAKPEQMKAATRAYPAAEVRRIVKDFTPINFGWIGYWAPGKETMGTQPDMLEYVTSRAAAWGCPISLSDGSSDLLTALQTHPRTTDNLEVIRRWEEVREKSWLTGEQKISLRDLDQEHTLLINEVGQFELVPWEEIKDAAMGSPSLRAFLFERSGKVWVAYWHPSGQGSLRISAGPGGMTVMRQIGNPLSQHAPATEATVPLGEVRYLYFTGVNLNETRNLVHEAKALPQ